MGISRLKRLAFSLAAFASFAPAPTNAQTYLRCTAVQQAQWAAAWNDAVHLAVAAWGTLTRRSNEALVSRYFPGVSLADRAMVELAFNYVANSPTVASTYILSCGDFQAGDPSSGIYPEIGTTNTICQDDPETNAYTIKFTGLPPATTGTTTNNIAGCAMLNADRTGSIEGLYSGTPAQLNAFCNETDFPLDPAIIGTQRRIYFRGWTFLHELLHTYSVGAMAGIMAQGLGDPMPFPGAADFAFDQELARLLPPLLAARNADSYAHFAWEAFFWDLCGKPAKAQGVVQAVPRYAAPERENLERHEATGSGSKALVARAKTTVTKPRTRRKKPGKIQKCRGCYQVPKGPKGVQKAGKIKKTPLKNCKAREIYIPMVLVGKKVNPKIKKGTCVPLPVVKGVSTKPGTTKPGKQTPVKLPVKKQVVVPKKRTQKRATSDK